MGACAGKPSPETKHGSGKKTEGGSVKKPEGPPDFGLGDTHENIKLLGRGGTGETYLMRDKRTGELQAVKLIRRPIPKVLMPNMFREMRVSSFAYYPLQFMFDVVSVVEAMLNCQFVRSKSTANARESLLRGEFISRLLFMTWDVLYNRYKPSLGKGTLMSSMRRRRF